jgi:hypothetical protein
VIASSAPRFSLPGTWGRINLASDATMHSSIRKVVEHSVGRDDKLASLRADLRNRFREAAEVARAGDAVDFHVALELAPGIPLPAWLGVFLPQLDQSEFDVLGLGELKAALEFASASTGGDRSAGSKDFELDRVRAVRHAFHRVRAATETEPALELLQVDYWLAAVAPARIALMTFTTNYVEFEEQMLELFDAVISTVRWPIPQIRPDVHVKEQDVI